MYSSLRYGLSYAPSAPFVVASVAAEAVPGSGSEGTLGLAELSAFVFFFFALLDSCCCCGGGMEATAVDIMILGFTGRLV